MKEDCKKPAHINKLASDLLSWFSSHARDLPWRRTCEPYAIWISEIMLQQTQVKTVIPYWERWMRALPNVNALAHAKPETVLKLWEGLGYYSRARNAQKAARMIVDTIDGKFPTTLEGVLNLPGVGRYTAGAICSIAFNQPVPTLDGNVARVITRLYGIGGDVKSKSINARLWQHAGELVETAHRLPDRRLAGISDCALQIAENLGFAKSQLSSSPAAFAGNCSCLNQSLMELGALVCTPKAPDCSHCPIAGLCVARGSNRVDQFPTPVARATATQRKFAAFVVSKNQRYLVRQRPDTGVNASFWEFPNIELLRGVRPTPALASPFVLASRKPLMRIMHSITRYRMQLEVFPATLEPGAKPSGSWLSLDKLKQLPFTSAHRKIVASLPIQK